MDKLLIATSNPGKVKEIIELLNGLDCDVIGLSDLDHLPPPVEETGKTFVENALIKGRYYFAHSGLYTLADDSGLEVDALGGRPGVYSARYGGEGTSSAEQIEMLLEELKDVPEERRTARFICSTAIVGPGLEKTFEGRCEGKISFAPRGTGGFGYDPVFIDGALNRTFAELSGAEKSSHSHRGNALRETKKFLERFFMRKAGR